MVEHDATLEVFRHSVDEIRDNLTASWRGAESGFGFGATVRRLQGAVYKAYVSAVRGDLEGAIEREGVKIVDPPTRQAIYQHFSESDEEGVYGMLGSFVNPLAQKRDAASVAAVMRIRQGRHAKLGQFHLANCIFVTDNPRVADCGARYAVRKKILNQNEVPPAVTDRYLAGTLWVLFGGKATELSEYKLLASCSAALEPRNDVSSKVQKFLRQVEAREHLESTRRAAMSVAARAEADRRTQDRRRLREKIPMIEDAMSFAQSRYRYTRYQQAGMLFLFTAGAAFIGVNYFTDWKAWMSIPSVVLGGLVAASFLLLEKHFASLASKNRNAAFTARAMDLEFLEDLPHFEVNWETGKAALKEED